MKASVIAGLKWLPLILALKIKRIKNPQRKPVASNEVMDEFQRAVKSIVPKNSNKRMRKDSFNVCMQFYCCIFNCFFSSFFLIN